MQKIFTHEVAGIHNIGVYVLDEKDANSCHHRYGIDYLNRENCRHIDALLQFQMGPVKDKGPNGVTIESLLSVCLHRLQTLQQGALACNENDVAVKNIEKALETLKQRTLRRIAGKIEGELVGDRDEPANEGE